jgi:tight adherence protein C
MLSFAMVLAFLAVVLLVYGLFPGAKTDSRPKLNLQEMGAGTPTVEVRAPKKKASLIPIRFLSMALKPLIVPEMRRRLIKDLSISQSDMSPEDFMFFKVVTVTAFLVLLPQLFPKDMIIFSVLIGIVVGYMLPEVWIRNKIKKIKNDVVKQLPDTVDLLGLCVNAGLDFMMALKWVVEKSPPGIVVIELGNLLQEISVGKPRRDALRDLARKYELPDLSTFSRTLIQADKMGTSVSEALNILSEDMRLARYRRGEALALKAPMKLLVPLLFCIFPVVGILVGAPIFLDFIMNNPIKKMQMS